jgi:O-antigen/teichoic acid export membrane protein
VTWSKAVESLSDVAYGCFQQHERMDFQAISMIVKGLLALGAMAAGVALTGDVLWGVLGMGAVWVVLVVAFDLRFTRRLVVAAIRNSGQDAATPAGKSDAKRARLEPPGTEGGSRSGFGPQWRWGTQWRLICMAGPLGVAAALSSLQPNIPRYFIEHRFGLAELGVYSALAYLMVAGGTVVGALGQSAGPRLAHYYADRQWASFRRLLVGVFGVFACIGIGGILVAWLFGYPVLVVLYRQEYARHQDVLLWIAVAAAVNYAYVFWGTVLSAMRRFAVKLPLQLLAVVAVLVASYFLVGDFGLKGAAWALVAGESIAALAYFGVTLFILRRIRRMDAGDKTFRSVGRCGPVS